MKWTRLRTNGHEDNTEEVSVADRLPSTSNLEEVTGHFTGSWFIGDDPEQDEDCVQQACHTPV